MRTRGFTLIELLIAMAIFAILAVLSYRTLGGLLSTREQLNAETTKWRDAALLFARVENDLAAILDRPVRANDDRANAALCLSAFAPTGNDATLSFTRTGFVDFAIQQDDTAAPQRVGYRFKGEKIEWMLSPALDQAPRSEPQIHTALKNIRDAKWRALDRNNNWRSDWPATGCAQNEKVATLLPVALELSVTLATGEMVKRVFVVRGG